MNLTGCYCGPSTTFKSNGDEKGLAFMAGSVSLADLFARSAMTVSRLPDVGSFASCQKEGVVRYDMDEREMHGHRHRRIHTHRHTHRQTQTDRYTEQTETKLIEVIERWTGRQTIRETDWRQRQIDRQEAVR